MTVAELIRRLQCLPPDTLVVKFADAEGYNDVLFLWDFEVVARRGLRAPGVGKFDNVEVRPGTRAKRTRAVAFS